MTPACDPKQHFFMEEQGARARARRGKGKGQGQGARGRGKGKGKGRSGQERIKHRRAIFD